MAAGKPPQMGPTDPANVERAGAGRTDDSQAAIRLAASYQVLAERRVYQDSLVWQTPLVTLTALAFLYFIALSATTSRTARIIAGVLALCVTVTSWQLLERHRYRTHLDGRLLRRLEAEQRLPQWHLDDDKKRTELLKGQDPLFYPRIGVYSDKPDGELKVSVLAKLSSYWAWKICLWAFMVVSGTIIVISVWWPSWLT